MKARFIILIILIYFSQASYAGDTAFGVAQVNQAKELLGSLISSEANLDEALNILLDFSPGTNTEEKVENTLSLLKTFSQRLPTYLALLTSLIDQPDYRNFFLGQEVSSVLLGFKPLSTYIPLGTFSKSLQETITEANTFRGIVGKFFGSSILISNESPAIFSNRKSCLQTQIESIERQLGDGLLKESDANKTLGTLRFQLKMLKRQKIILEGTVISLQDNSAPMDSSLSLGLRLGYDSSSVLVFNLQSPRNYEGYNVAAWPDDFFPRRYDISWMVFPDTAPSAKKKMAGYRLLLQTLKAKILESLNT